MVFPGCSELLGMERKVVAPGVQQSDRALQTLRPWLSQSVVRL